MSPLSRFIGHAGILVLAVLAGGAATAKDVYIRDTLYVPLRGGQSTEHRILHRGLRSEEKAEVADAARRGGSER